MTTYPEGLVQWRDSALPHWVSAGTDTPEHRARQVCCYASLIDSKTLDQCKALARMPFVEPYVAVMPDAHLGTGAAVGSVVPTKDAVIPAAVGVDLGCGMIALRTNIKLDEVRAHIASGHPIEDLRDAVEAAIPASAGNYNKNTTQYSFTRKRIAELDYMASGTNVDFSGIRNAENWPNQLGTLGGGNHFIELSYDTDEYIWLFLHSGSRGVGNSLANRRIKQAQKLCKRWGVPLEQADLAYFPEGTPEFTQYLRDVNWAQHFALLNREEMMDRFIAAFTVWMGTGVVHEERINCHHNYVTKEGGLWVTRKGAIDAHSGVPGVIPGSMGSPSYVVRGKGCKTGLCSAPHGAGRLYGRRVAKETFTEEDLAAQMGDIVYRHGAAWVDEIPSAYKPIKQVISDASDLVEVVTELNQLMNVKGT